MAWTLSCTVDDETARRKLRTVLETAAELADGPLAGLRLAILHGRLAGR